MSTNAYVHIVYCPYMYNCLYVLFYRGPLDRLANLAKSANLLKYCIYIYIKKTWTKQIIILMTNARLMKVESIAEF